MLHIIESSYQQKAGKPFMKLTQDLCKVSMVSSYTEKLVKVQMCGWYMVLCLFLDNSDSPSIVEQ